MFAYLRLHICISYKHSASTCAIQSARVTPAPPVPPQVSCCLSDNSLLSGESSSDGLLASSNRQQSQDLGDKADPLQHPSGMFLRWDPGNDPGGQGEAAWMALLKKFNSLPPVDAAGAPPQEAVTFIPSHPARIYTGNPSRRE